MTRHVLAQGTFDILHPGHVHYLSEAASLGDQLHVVVARSENVTHKPDPILPDPQRREMVASLKPVDHARLGHPSDIFVPVEEIDPDVIALGYDQHHDEDALREALTARGLDCELERTSPHEAADEFCLSTGRIVDRVLAERG